MKRILIAAYALLLIFIICPSETADFSPPGQRTVSIGADGVGDGYNFKTSNPSPSGSPAFMSAAALDEIADALTEKFGGIVPKEWGETVSGVRAQLDTKEKVIALTFDACGGPGGSGYDEKLIDFLIDEKVPATLFINGRWIDKNPAVFLSLAENNLFEIENHGMGHLPLSVTGKSAYHIAGTKNIREVVDEVGENAERIYALTGRKPEFFRSGTAYYDEVATSVIGFLGEQAVGYTVLGDAGATYSQEQVRRACLSAKPGAIIICHMNHPEKETAEGIIDAVPVLRSEGFRFVKLCDYALK